MWFARGEAIGKWKRDRKKGGGRKEKGEDRRGRGKAQEKRKWRRQTRKGEGSIEKGEEGEAKCLATGRRGEYRY